MSLISDVDLQDVIRTVAGVVPVLVAVVGFSRGPGAARSRLEHDANLLEKFPTGTEARTKYEDYLADQVGNFASFESTATRDTKGAITGFILVIIFIGLALWLVAFEEWWGYLGGAALGVFALAGLTVVYDDAQRVPRDDDKKPL